MGADHIFMFLLGLLVGIGLVCFMCITMVIFLQAVQL